ncbi:MAG: hypothetical protein JNL23_11210, partial [Chitinophagaceae bacterium]|nr:hypothetical protein [Chitinophagaceae bacterium]
MKKLLLILAVAGFVACNNATESTETKVDSAVKAVENTAAAAKDSIGAAVDSAAAKI